jgi:hypothetical protein
MRCIQQEHVNATMTSGGGSRGLDWCIVLGQLSTIERSTFKLRTTLVTVMFVSFIPYSTENRLVRCTRQIRHGDNPPY